MFLISRSKLRSKDKTIFFNDHYWLHSTPFPLKGKDSQQVLALNKDLKITSACMSSNQSLISWKLTNTSHWNLKGKRWQGHEEDSIIKTLQ